MQCNRFHNFIQDAAIFMDNPATFLEKRGRQACRNVKQAKTFPMSWL
jgi:hypothetical protein